MSPRKPTPRKPMDPYFAMFNCHVNNAKEKAMFSFVEKFGQAAWDAHLAVPYRDGVMALFNVAPTEWTMFYVLEVQRFVNEGCAP